MTIQAKLRIDDVLRARQQLMDRQHKLLVALQDARNWVPAKDPLSSSCDELLRNLARAMVENGQRMWDLSGEQAKSEKCVKESGGAGREESLPW